MMTDQIQPSRIINVSNRLPINLNRDPQYPDQWRIEQSVGGLVSALSPVLRKSNGEWIGWTGVVEEDRVDVKALLSDVHDEIGYMLTPVELTIEQHDLFYLGFSNEIIWPLFHDLQTRANFDPRYFAAFEAVNQRFAHVIAERAQKHDTIWIHDYHLINTAKELRMLHMHCASLIFFLHIPFPAPDIFMKLPWRTEILAGLLEYDLIGFQTQRDHDNFIACMQALYSDTTIEAHDANRTITTGQKSVQLGVFPIGIDVDYLETLATSREVADLTRQLQGALGQQQIILGVDRLDYTKGIEHRFKAFRHALLRYPELQHQVTFVQIVVPSRTDIPEYHELKSRIERLVGEINGQFTHLGWVPIQYIYRSLDLPELLAHYCAADIALVTPLKDGMNLVAKEYCVAHVDLQGVLILSEFAGAAAQLESHALMVNPYDIDGVADALLQAYHMLLKERMQRMNALRSNVLQYHVFWWADQILNVQPETIPSSLTSSDPSY